MFVDARREKGLSLFNKLLAVLILMSLFVTILETEYALYHNFSKDFYHFEIIMAAIFGVEYSVRVWAAGCEARYQGLRGRLRFIFQFGSIIDLLAFLPTLLTIGGINTFVLRMARLARLIRFAKLGRYSSAIRNIENALRSCGRELMISFPMAFSLIVFGATVLYTLEGQVQPETFGSIPRALWWSVVTLTTVGYGDVYPITTLGKVFAGIIAFVGVATVALPAGILAAAFQEGAANKQRQERNEQNESLRNPSITE